MTEDLWTYDRFETGQDHGAVAVALDAERVAGWEAVYGPVRGDAAPDGLIVAGMMEAYIRAIQPRPKGNVHASQKLAFTGARAKLGDEVLYRVSVAGKELKKDRRWVSFAVEAEAGGRPLMCGEIISIWAA